MFINNINFFTGSESTDPDLKSSSVTDEMVLEEAKEKFFTLQCRSIRIGSYKSMGKERSHFSTKGIQLKVPDMYNRKDHLYLLICDCS